MPPRKAPPCRAEPGCDTSYRVGLEFHDDRVRVTVSDRGKGFSPDDLPPPGTPRPDAHGGLRIGGFGLPLAALLSDRLEFRPTEPHGATVRAVIALRYRSPAAAGEAARLEQEGGGGSEGTA